MYFSEKFNIDKQTIEDYGAIDISLVCDIPLFIDPMLIFNSKKPEYIKLHEDIIKFFNHLYLQSKLPYNSGILKTYYKFGEVKNNWLGYSKSNNQGRGLGLGFAKFLIENFEFIINTNNISQSVHIEKALLLYDGNGRDKISDMTVNLILGYLAKYTQDFALQYINRSQLANFPINDEFNYKTNGFNSNLYTLPFIINDKGQKEFVLLTPRDILRVEEPAISKKNFLRSYSDIRQSIDNDILRTQLNNYICVRVTQFQKSCEEQNHKPTEKELQRFEKDAFYDAAKEYPWLYDYFIKYIEVNGDKISTLSDNEVSSQLAKFFDNSKRFTQIYKEQYPNEFGILNSRDELIKRIEYFKHCIEDCDCYKCFYDKNGVRISNEDDLQRFFRLVWYNTIFDVNYEANNGRGELDVKVSFGAKDKTIAEFKLASNPKLNDICEQTEVYEKATQTTQESIYVIFYFTLEEYSKVRTMLMSSPNKEKLLKNIILIDCRKDNKESGSKVKAS